MANIDHRMARKSANQLKKGNYFIYEDEPYIVQSNDHSKSGKHGHAKSRIGCENLFTQKKKSFTFTANTTFDVPEIIKRSGQVVNINAADKMVTTMDLETYETIDIMYPVDDDEVVLGKLQQLVDDPALMAESSVEFWTVMGKSFVTRVMIP